MTIVPPQFLQTATRYVGVVSNGLVAISAPVVGLGPITFQWLLNTAPVTGATNDSLVIASAGPANLGNYQLVAANRAGSATSAVVNVSFLDPSGNGLPLAWELYYFGTNGLSAYADPDASGATLFQDYSQGYNPTNTGSATSYTGPINWVNNNGGNWSVAENWRPARVPSAADTVLITAPGTYSVTLDTDATVAGITLGGGDGGTAQSFFTSGHTLAVNGQIQVNSQGQFNLDSGTLAVKGEIQVNAQGELNLNGGTLGGTTQIQVNPQGQFNLNGGTFEGTNVISIGGTLSWGGGANQFLSGTMTVSNGGAFNIMSGGGEADFNGLTLTNYGTVNWTNTTLYGVNGNNAQIYNYGLWNEQSDEIFHGGYLPGGSDSGTTLFDNFGTFLKSGTSGTSTLDGYVVFNNTGTVNVQSGNLTVDGSYNLAGGRLNFGVNSAASFGSISLAGAATLNGTASANLNDGFIPVAGDTNPTVLPVNKGESHGDSRIDSRNPIPSCPDLAQVVTAWAKLSSPIKTAILALVKTAG